MLSTLCMRFGVPGAISVLALVFAMFGGAYAASNSSDGGKATASAKAKKGPRGPKGATGPAGPAGLAGPAGAKGDTGAAGSNGAAGDKGATGTTGATGTSVTNTAVSAGGSKCEGRAGAEFKAGAGAATFACNGKDGQTGFTETLPPGKTETGTWSLTMGASVLMTSSSSISFPIPLAEEGGSESAFGFNKADTAAEKFGKDTTTGAGCEVGTAGCVDTGCEGTVGNPTAPPGVLCVYTTFENYENAFGGFLELRSPGGGFITYGPSGALLFSAFLEGTPETPSYIESYGSWAVTAPVAP